ncbi:MAG: response regulator [Chitinispirillales bacterium]|jgi:CheY-like chemotaxis protein/HPt (histidine-containing phosphotransfer) domain-containing protein|nr:response regulator [Chitinispirillales bacterium]
MEKSQRSVETMIAAADVLFTYVEDMIHAPANASLNTSALPKEFVKLGKNLEFLFKQISETRVFAKELAAGNLDCAPAAPDNEMTAPLKNLHASLKHLTWQTQHISKGDYSQRIAFMDNFSHAFNNIIEHLDRQREHSLDELREALQRAEEARERAEEASRAKTIFLANMNHEMRTPLNTILGIAEIQLMDETLSPGQQDVFLRINNSGGLLLNIINHLLDLFKMEPEKVELALAEYEFRSGWLGKESTENMTQLSIDKEMHTKSAKLMREYMPYASVLVVDDVESNLYVARGLLSPYGLSSDTAMSGFEAIDKIRNGNVYDIIFMDYMMPEMDGIETFNKIRDMGYEKPIVALTANTVVGQAEMFLSKGFDSFLSKPIDVTVLNDVLNRFIRDKQMPEVIEEARASRPLTVDAAPKTAQSVDIDPNLLTIFVRDVKRVLPTFEKALKNIDTISDKDLRLFTIDVHAMKSALVNVNENALSATAAGLEAAGKNGDKKMISATLPRFFNDLSALIEKFTPDEDENCETADENPEYLAKQLFVFKKECENYNKKGAKTIIAELCRKQCSRKTKELFSAFSEYLLHGDFEEAAAKAQEFAESLVMKTTLTTGLRPK